MKLLAYEKLTLLTEQLLVIMAKKRHQQQVQYQPLQTFL